MKTDETTPETNVTIGMLEKLLSTANRIVLKEKTLCGGAKKYKDWYAAAALATGIVLEEAEVNPFVINSESDRTFFPFILSSPSRVRIDVFGLNGERIRTIRPKRDIVLSREEYTDIASLRELDLFWDGRNEEGEYVSSGVYLYQFRTDRNTEVMKIAVIR